MNWKIGDKVRLTGKRWPTDKDHEVRRGSEHTVTSVKNGRVRLSGWGIKSGQDGEYYWKIVKGWEIELVERKDSVMSVDFSDVNVGDKVRLTRGNGDEATFTVKIKRKQFISSESQNFSTKFWDTLEIVERAFKPVPGLYTNNKTGDRAVLLENGEAYFTASEGAWVTSDHENENRQTYQAVREQSGWKREITF